MVDPLSQITLSRVAHYVYEYGPKIYALLRKEKDRLAEIEARLAAIESKIDQIIIRDIESSFKIIDGLVATSSEAMRDRHLIQAEANLLRNIGLGPDKKLCGMSGSYWVAKCYFGLSCVAVMRGEQADAARYLLQAFVLDPFQAREELATDFFNEIMLPYCGEVVKTKEAELARLPEYDARRSNLNSQAFWCEARGMTVGGIAALGSLFMGRSGRSLSSVGMHYTAREQSEAASLNQKAREIPTEQSIREAANESLDARCREIATQLLQGGAYPLPNAGASDPPSYPGSAAGPAI